MNNFYTDLFFILLNNSLYIGLVVWFIKRQLLPAIRASKTMQDETRTHLSTEISQQHMVLQKTQDNYQIQAREIARLTTTLEKWAGVLSQRAALVEREHQELSFRYKERCAENARVRALKSAHTRITTQVLKNVRALLKQEYSAPEKQQDYLECVAAYLRKDAHDRA
jgi:hypothetical protein